jgi:predicted flap endonuclease-1-like 5' DNA nuclease
MSFLLAKILLLLLLAALLGAWLTRWWLRRHYEDVSVEYIGLREDWARWRKGLDEKLGRPPVDLEPLAGRLSVLERAVRGIDIPQPQPTDLSPVLAAVSAIRMPEVPRVDLAPLADRLGALEQRVAAIRMPEPTPPTDLSPVLQRLADVQQRVGAIVIPAPREPDLAPLQAKLEAVERSVAAIRMPPAPDLSGVEGRLAGLERQLTEVAQAKPPAPAPVDLAPTQQRLEALERAVSAIVIPPAKEPDLSAVVSRLGGLETQLGAWRMPEPPPAVDLAPLQAKLEAVERAVAAIRVPPAPDLSSLDGRLAGLEGKLTELAQATPPAPAPVDLAPTQQRLEALERAVRAIVIPTPKEPDFSALTTRIGGIESRLGALHMPEPVDLAPLAQRVGELEAAVRDVRVPAPAPAATLDLAAMLQRLDAMETHWSRASAAAPAAPAMVAAGSGLATEHVRPGSRNLLARAAYGKPDDLKIIKGVATVLEKTLHKIGVYYFWQIAEWSAKDVAQVDSLLTAFKGRIQRDDWVRQAAQLATLSESARRPA